MATTYFKVVSDVALAGDDASGVGVDIKRSVNSKAVGTANAVVTAGAAATTLTNEVTQIKVDATAGNFTVTVGAATTPNQAFNVAAATLGAAINALSTVGAGGVKVGGGPGNSGGTTPYIVEWLASFAHTDVTQPSATNVSLTGGGAAVTVSTLIAGAVAGD